MYSMHHGGRAGDSPSMRTAICPGDAVCAARLGNGRDGRSVVLKGQGGTMKSRWDEKEAARYQGDLAQRVYTSRLLGSDPSLVLHGGGNTSVKIRERNILGEEEWILHVKGSGWDLATIEAAGFSPVRMDRLLGLARLPALSDSQMAAELRSNMTDAGAPRALRRGDPARDPALHLRRSHPRRRADRDHQHPARAEHVREAYGDSVVIIPYVMPGFRLARLCAERFPAEAGPQTVGMVLMNHGLFTFGETARASYELMIELVGRAEEYLARRDAWHIDIAAGIQHTPVPRAELAALRSAVSAAAAAPMILASHTDEQSLDFARRDDLATIAQQGPATPDHVIRTKRMPMVGTDVAGYAAAYARYFEEQAPKLGGPLIMLDPAPRIVLGPELGMIAVGRTAKDAAIAEEVYRHTMEIILRATALESYQALPAADIFEVEYWDLEQAKLRRQGAPPPFAGEVALVTGAASGIGKACVEALLARGAAVVGLDINPAIAETGGRPDLLGIVCDVSDEAAIGRALDQAVARFGGLDMLVLNAGIFPPSQRIAALPLADWDRTLRVNLDANLVLLREAHPLLTLAPRGGRVAIIGSKNVPAPGSGRGGLLRLQGRPDPAGAGGGAGVGRGRDPRQRAASQRGVRHRYSGRTRCWPPAPRATG